MPAGMRLTIVPLGPSTSTKSSCILIFTPGGTGMIFFPILDIFRSLHPVSFELPNATQNFAAHAGLAGLSSSQNSFGSTEDVDTQTTQHRRNLLSRTINA